ncbi:MAG: family 10 glycosylhydrolase [Erysipelotrichales bacterium]|nr:family 10 glycosylhydrolase [Erysipelotrichales bacterium]
MRTIKRFIGPGNITYYGSKKEILVPLEYQEKNKELRGVWFSTVANIDIPVTKSAEECKAYLLGVIKTVKEHNMNAVVFQARPTNDAFYKSELNPWSSFITGTQGQEPGFDLLAFFIEEAKKENISVHAWLNPYRISHRKLSDLKMDKLTFLNTLATNNFARLNPDLVIETTETKLILDPASPKVIEFMAETVKELAMNYDIKSIHIDDYFYPYEPINDPEETVKHQASGIEKLSDFRRENVNKLIKKIHETLKALPKKVEFGISPFAVYRINSKLFEETRQNDEAAWEHGLDCHPSSFSCYKSLYADIYLWMKKGWIDYIVPQDYFAMDNRSMKDGIPGHETAKYCDIAKWWSNLAKETKTKLYMGQGLYLCKEEGIWSNPLEINNQMLYNQNYDNIVGTVFFTYKNLKEDNNRALIETRNNLKKFWTKPAKEI